MDSLWRWQSPSNICETPFHIEIAVLVHAHWVCSLILARFLCGSLSDRYTKGNFFSRGPLARNGAPFVGSMKNFQIRLLSESAKNLPTPSPDADGLLYHWAFDEAFAASTCVTARDAINGYDAFLRGNAQLFGNGVELSGGDRDRVFVPVVVLDGSAYAFTMHVKIVEVTSNAQLFMFYSEARHVAVELF